MKKTKQQQMVKHEIVIELPPNFFRKVRRLLDWLEIPLEGMEAEFRSAVLNEQYLDDEDLWVSGYVYPDRETAERVARKLCRRHRGRVDQEMTFMSEGKRRTVVFVDPNPPPPTEAELISRAEWLGRLQYGPPMLGPRQLEHVTMLAA